MKKQVVAVLVALASVAGLAGATSAYAGTPRSERIVVEKSDRVGDVYQDPGPGAFTKAERNTTDITFVKFEVNRRAQMFRVEITLRDLRPHAGDSQFFDIRFEEPGRNVTKSPFLFFRRGGERVTAYVFTGGFYDSSRCKTAMVKTRWKKDQMVLVAPLSCVGSPAEAAVEISSTVNNYDRDKFDPDMVGDDVRTRNLPLAPVTP